MAEPVSEQGVDEKPQYIPDCPFCGTPIFVIELSWDEIITWWKCERCRVDFSTIEMR